MVVEYQQTEWDDELVADARELVRLALREDLRDEGDLTSSAVVEAGATGCVDMVAREPMVISGLGIGPIVLDEVGYDANWMTSANDGDHVTAKQTLAMMQGHVRELMTAERLILNIVSKLSGVATLTSRYVAAIEGTTAHVYDTRKTTPGFRRLEKYAVRCGGGRNHRTGLYDGILIKDNHLAHMATTEDDDEVAPFQAVTRAKKCLAGLPQERQSTTLLEIEVDTLEQYAHALRADPDIILLDNMSLDELTSAVSLRNQVNSSTQLEASGGVNLDTIRSIAETGVDRISVGALTHQSVWLDIGLDWSRV